MSGLTDESTIINNGTINVLEVFLRGSTMIVPYPTLNNNGTMNTVRISTLTGTLNNSGDINDAQISLQFGIVNNDSGGTIITTYTLSTMGSRFINGTVFDNYGTVTNEATIKNNGTFNNFGTFDNTSGTFSNTADFGKGTIGIFDNTGVLLGNPISNEGALWDNDSGNGLWSNPINWSGDVLPASTDDIIINIVDGADTTVTVNMDITIDGRLALMNSAGPPITSTLVIQSGATLTNNGRITPGQNTTINNQGSIVNNGEIRAVCSVSFINDGSFSGNPVLGICRTWDGGGIDDLWSTPENWSGDTLPQTGDTITISGSAGEVVLDTDFTLVGKLTIDGNGTTLRIDNGVTLTLLAPGPNETVTVSNGGTLINDGVVEGVDLSPLSRILVTSMSGLTDESTIINNGTLNVLEVFVRGSTMIVPYPTLNNNGTMNTVRISTNTGTINNSGDIDDAQISLQFGTFNNDVGGMINITYTLSTMGSRFINNTVFNNYGTVTNEAKIENKGTFNNFGTFDNTIGTFDNQGTFNSECGNTLLGTISGNPVNEIPCNNATPAIDIKPGSDPNSINLGSNGVIPVAILTDGSFDAASVNATTVLFGRTGSEAEPVHYALEDVDDDGDMDMIFHFRTQDTGLEAEDTEAILTGQTIDGIEITGTDSVRIVPPKGKGKPNEGSKPEKGGGQGNGNGNPNPGPGNNQGGGNDNPNSGPGSDPGGGNDNPNPGQGNNQGGGNDNPNPGQGNNQGGGNDNPNLGQGNGKGKGNK